MSILDSHIKMLYELALSEKEEFAKSSFYYTITQSIKYASKALKTITTKCEMSAFWAF